jgi:hypothetical protein
MLANQGRKNGIASKQQSPRAEVFFRCHDERIIPCQPAVPADELGCCR